MSWKDSIKKNIGMDKLKEEVMAINDMMEEYESERDSVMDKLDELVKDIGKKILDVRELSDDKDIRRMAEDMRSGVFDPINFDDIWYMMNSKAGFPEKPTMTPDKMQEEINRFR